MATPPLWLISEPIFSQKPSWAFERSHRGLSIDPPLGVRTPPRGCGENQLRRKNKIASFPGGRGGVFIMRDTRYLAKTEDVILRSKRRRIHVRRKSNNNTYSRYTMFQRRKRYRVNAPPESKKKKLYVRKQGVIYPDKVPEESGIRGSIPWTCVACGRFFAGYPLTVSSMLLLLRFLSPRSTNRHELIRGHKTGSEARGI